MKVNIGPYRNDIIPIRRLERKYESMRSGRYYHDEDERNWADRIVYKTFDALAYIFGPINRWSNNRKRKEKIHVDSYDVWNADHTLAKVIHPVLVKLKQVKHGHPCIDNEDVPENLRISDNDKEKLHYDGTVDDNHEARWNYVLDEMIWAFEQCAEPDKGEDQFHHNLEQLEILFTPCEDNPKYRSVDFNYQKDPTKPKYWVDNEAKKLHYDRISNGLRLFAKYYFSLWD